VRACKNPAWLVVLAADATRLYNHIEERRVYPNVDNMARVHEGYDLLERLATSRQHVIPGHDPAVLYRYPAAGPGASRLGGPARAEPRRS
jgi:hypothetical protein